MMTWPLLGAAASAMAFAVEHALRMLVLVTVVGGVLRATRRASARTELLAWATVLAVLFVMFAAGGVVPQLEVPLPIWSGSQPTMAAVASASASSSLVAIATPGNVPAFDPTQVLRLAGAVLYVTFGCALLLRLGLGWRLTRRLLQGADPISDVDLLARTARHAADLGLSAVPRLLESDLVHVPFVSSLRRPAIVLPHSWRAWPASSTDAVLLHELAHISRGDLLWMHLAAIYRAATWINPMSWWLRRRIERLAEAASDEAVLTGGIEPVTYAETLLDFFARAQHTPRRAEWNLAMARRNAGADAERRIKQVLRWKGGSAMALTLKKRLFIAAGVLVVAAPAMLVTMARLDPGNVARLLPQEVTVTAALPPTAPSVPPETGPVTVPSTPRVVERRTRRVYTKDTPGLILPKLGEGRDPRYTPSAMRAKIQGTVELMVLIEANGVVSAVEVVKSLDTIYGLDDEAVNAAYQWVFTPGRLNGEAVPVRVTIVMQFRLH